MMNLDEAILKEHYAHIADKQFFPEIVEYMTSGPVFGMIVEGENAVQGMRIIMGATKFEEATAGTIRGDFASSTGANVIHGSDSVENAKLKSKIFQQIIKCLLKEQPTKGLLFVLQIILFSFFKYRSVFKI